MILILQNKSLCDRTCITAGSVMTSIVDTPLHAITCRLRDPRVTLAVIKCSPFCHTVTQIMYIDITLTWNEQHCDNMF
jgi:hypothetical protein